MGLMGRFDEIKVWRFCEPCQITWKGDDEICFGCGQWVPVNSGGPNLLSPHHFTVSTSPWTEA